MNKLSAYMLLGTIASGCLAQDLSPKAPPQSHPIYLAGATVHTVSGEDIENGLVGFNEGRLTLVGSASALQMIQLSPDSDIIDVSGQHIYPGLFASETQLGITEVGAVRATHDYDEVGAFTPEVRASVSVNPDSTLIPVTRMGGVLLAGVFPTGGQVPGRASIIRLDGWTWEDMTVEDSAGLLINWPNPRASQDWWSDQPNARQRDRARDAMKTFDIFFDSVEAYRAAHASDDDAPVDYRLASAGEFIPTAEGEAPTRPALLLANDYDEIVSGVTWAIDRGMKPVIVGGQDAALAADLLIANDVPVIVSGTHSFPKRADAPHDDAYTLPARLHEAGIRFALAGAERDGNYRNLPYEAGMASRFGLPKAEAIRAITLTPAEIFGIEDTYGSIERGKSATLIVVDGDVLEPTTNVTLAFIDGKSIPMTSKQTELRDKYREKYQQLGIIEDDADKTQD